MTRKSYEILSKGNQLSLRASHKGVRIPLGCEEYLRKITLIPGEEPFWSLCEEVVTSENLPVGIKKDVLAFYNSPAGEIHANRTC
jgi:hypothetical protein